MTILATPVSQRDQSPVNSYELRNVATRRLAAAAIVGSVAVQIPGALYRRCIKRRRRGRCRTSLRQRVPFPEYQNRGFALCARLGGRQQVVINSVQNNQPAGIVEGNGRRTGAKGVKNDSRFIPPVPPSNETHCEILKAFVCESRRHMRNIKTAY